ncbi:hypothetical protein ABK040_008152 [Willaertia magna]
MSTLPINNQKTNQQQEEGKSSSQSEQQTSDNKGNETEEFRDRYEVIKVVGDQIIVNQQLENLKSTKSKKDNNNVLNYLKKEFSTIFGEHPNIWISMESVQSSNLNSMKEWYEMLDKKGNCKLSLKEFITLFYKNINEIKDDHKNYCILFVRIFYQLTSALQYLHSQNYLMRDLQPQQIIVDFTKFNEESTSDSLLTQLKVHCKLTLLQKEEKIERIFPYMSPEVESLISDVNYTTDIFSLGVVLYELLSGTNLMNKRELSILCQLYDRNEWKKQIDSNLKFFSLSNDLQQDKEMINDLHESLLNILVDCLKYNVKERPSASDILQKLDDSIYNKYNIQHIVNTPYEEEENKSEKEETKKLPTILKKIESDWEEKRNELIGKTIDEKYILKKSFGGGGESDIFECKIIDEHIKKKLENDKCLIKFIKRGINSELSNFIHDIVQVKTPQSPVSININKDEFDEEAIKEEERKKRKVNPYLLEFADIQHSSLLGCPYIVIPKFGEALDSFIEDKEEPISFNDLLSISYQIADGLEELHLNNIVHADFKPENLLITFDEESKLYHVKLIDYGLSRRVYEKGQRGSGYTNAPECYKELKGKLESDVKQDVFSFGCSLYYLVTHRKDISYLDIEKYIPKDVLSNCDRTIAVTLELFRMYSTEEEFYNALMNILRKYWKQEDNVKVELFFKLIISCLNWDMNERPSMEIIKKQLKHLME